MPYDERSDIHELLRRRWSPRAFSPRPVRADTLARLFEAARWAASSLNEQPWGFVVADARDRPEDFARLLGCLNESNAVWAGAAPVLMLSVAKRRFDRGGAENRHAWHDVGQAAASLTLQATAEGLAAHQMAGFDADRAREELGLPEGWDPVAVIAVGYPGDPEALPEKLRERERAVRTRKPSSEFVFRGRWGENGAL